MTTLTKDKLDELKLFCQNKKIPIVRDETIAFISELIRQNNSINILEIGTAYGYSANYLWYHNDNLFIDTIENDHEKFLKASQYKCDNIHYIFGSVFEYNFVKIYDLIFIDGPKSNQEKIFENLQKNLKENGLIVIDNIFLKDVKPTNKSKIKLIEKNKKFINYLNNLNDWEIKIIEIDDGLAICKRKKDENSS